MHPGQDIMLHYISLYKPQGIYQEEHYEFININELFYLGGGPTQWCFSQSESENAPLSAEKAHDLQHGKSLISITTVSIDLYPL